MRLTQLHREAFVRAAMNDVPEIDYREQARKIAQDFQVKKMPPEVRAVYQKPELRGYLKSNSWGLRFNYGHISLYGDAPLDVATKEKIADLERLSLDQENQRSQLREKLNGVLRSVTTRKALIEALPEFEKYAPAEVEPSSRNLPALANLVSDFVAAGWPKDKPKLAAKRARKTAAK